MFIILIHELGHFITALFLKLNVSNIKIFMFGGVTTFNESLNVSIYKELLMLLMGPISQVLFWLLIFYLYRVNLVSSLTFNKICVINKVLLSFNLLPIIPLDGGKLLNNFLNLFLNYDISHKISIIISIISLPLIFLIFNKLISIFILVFLILNIIEEITTHKYKLYYIILDRKIHNIKFNKTKNITKINKIYRNKNYILK